MTAAATETVGRRSGGLKGPVWRLGASLVAVGFLGFGTVNVVQQVARERETIVTELDGSGVRMVEVRNRTGPVHIVGTGGDTVRITARVEHGLQATRHDERIEGERLVLDASCPILSSVCRVRYDVEVPRDVAVDMRTANESVSVTDVTGDVEASTSNGRVEVVRVTGDVRLRSGNGRVVGTELSSPVVEATTRNGAVDLGLAESPRTVEARSGNGRVEIVLPDGPDDQDVHYRVDASSRNGTVDTPIRQDPASDRAVTATTGNGRITIRYPSG